MSATRIQPPPALFAPDRAKVSTLPELLEERVRRTPHRQAYSDGRETVTWSEFGARVDSLAMALADLGLEHRDVVAVIGQTTGEWATADQAILAAGGSCMGVYSTLTPTQVAYQLNDSRARIAFAGSPEELAILRGARTQAPGLQVIIGWGSAEGAGPDVLDYSALLARGAAQKAKHPEELARRKALSRRDDVALLIYTSGTTGIPKGAMLTHWNCVFQVKTIESFLPGELDDDCTVSFLPMAHAAEHVVGFYARINTGLTTRYVGSLDSEQVLAAIATARPTIFGSVPRIFEKGYAKIRARVAAATPRQRAIFSWADQVGRAFSRHAQAGSAAPIGLRLRHALADRLVFRKVRRAFGGRCKWFVSGAAPIDVEILEFFHACGMLVLEGYGLTECSGISNINRLAEFRFGTVGPALPGTEVRLAGDGEILIHGPHVFAGYLNQPEASREAVDSDGWLHTGDVGEIDDGRWLRITDRKKNLIVTSSGKNIAPAAIEALLTSEPILGPVLIIGDQRPYLTALVTLDPVEARASSGAPQASLAALARRPEIRERVRQAFVRANRELARYEQVRRFRILDREMSIADGELTPTLKLRRKIVRERYQSEVNSLYGQGDPEVIELRSE